MDIDRGGGGGISDCGGSLRHQQRGRAQPHNIQSLRLRLLGARFLTGVERGEDGAVADYDLGCGGISGARIVEHDTGHIARGRIPNHMGFGLDPVWIVRHIEVDRRHGVSGANMGQGERIDAAVSDRCGLRRRPTARNRDGGCDVIGAVLADGDGRNHAR